LKYYFFSYFKKNFIESQMNIVTRSSLSQEVLKRVPVLVPPLDEQQQIVTYLDEQTQLIDQTIQQEEQKIELLKEYRQSLISEVVTGKICVLGN
jgi:type I restriction enzyme S subunit